MKAAHSESEQMAMPRAVVPAQNRLVQRQEVVDQLAARVPAQALLAPLMPTATISSTSIQPSASSAGRGSASGAPGSAAGGARGGAAAGGAASDSKAGSFRPPANNTAVGKNEASNTRPAAPKRPPPAAPGAHGKGGSKRGHFRTGTVAADRANDPKRAGQEAEQRRLRQWKPTAQCRVPPPGYSVLMFEEDEKAAAAAAAAERAAADAIKYAPPEELGLFTFAALRSGDFPRGLARGNLNPTIKEVRDVHDFVGSIAELPSCPARSNICRMKTSPLF